MTDPVIAPIAEAFDLAQLTAGAREALRVLDAGGSLTRVTGGWRARTGRVFSRDTVSKLQQLGLVERGAAARPVLVLTELGKALQARIARRGKAA